MQLREYTPSDCAQMAELFYQTVHSVNAKDYTQEQLDAWATGEVDLQALDESFQAHKTDIAVENDDIIGFGDMDESGYLDRLYVHKDYQGQEKGLLRRAVEGLLPEPVLHRKKSPYPKTFDPRYEQLMETRLQAILDDPAAPLWQLVSAEEVKKLLHRETQWPWYGQLMRRPQTIAYLCQIDFWLRHYSVELMF